VATPRGAEQSEDPEAAAEVDPAWLLTDQAGVIRDVSDRAAALLNTPAQFLIGKPILVFFPTDSYTRLLKHLQTARRQRQTWTMRLLPWQRPPIELALTASPIWNERMLARGLGWTLAPTGAPAASPAFKKAGVAAGAPRPPTSNGPTAPASPADDVETMRRAFLSAMSHELLTPLSIIQGHAETLRYPAVRADQGQVDLALSAIRDETARLRRLVQNVIDTARASAGELHVEPTPSAIEPMLTLTVHRFEARSRRHRFITELPASVPLVLADLERLESVVYNLLDNALKYSPRGGMIRVRVAPRATEVEVSVEDEGLGVAPGEETNVFAPYYRAGQALDARAQGSGLGLYLSKAVIDAHGGRIWIEPRPEGGTAVRFTLPLA
jgi:signal transduction histidine kinase